MPASQYFDRILAKTNILETLERFMSRLLVSILKVVGGTLAWNESLHKV